MPPRNAKLQPRATQSIQKSESRTLGALNSMLPRQVVKTKKQLFHGMTKSEPLDHILGRPRA